mgnify:CR=1 FL=1
MNESGASPSHQMPPQPRRKGNSYQASVSRKRTSDSPNLGGSETSLKSSSTNIKISKRSRKNCHSFKSEWCAWGLDGPLIFLNDNLTKIQIDHRKQCMPQIIHAHKEGRKVLCWDGHVIINSKIRAMHWSLELQWSTYIWEEWKRSWQDETCSSLQRCTKAQRKIYISEGLSMGVCIQSDHKTKYITWVNRNRAPLPTALQTRIEIVEVMQRLDKCRSSLSSQRHESYSLCYVTSLLRDQNMLLPI